MATTKAQEKSFIDRTLDRISPQPAAPPHPSAPPVNQSACEESVDSHSVNTLTVRQIGLIVFNETQPFTDSDNANDTTGGAREKVAHTLINADSMLGKKRPRTARPIEPTANALKNPQVKRAYESSLAAARDAYLSAHDPTGGATNFQFLTNASRSNFIFKGGTPEGLPIKTQSGPFDNSYTRGDVPSRHVYVDTYGK